MDLAFANPDPAWQRFPPAATRLLLLLLAEAIKAEARELMVVTVDSHHASVSLVVDRTPREIVQLALLHYDDIRLFLSEGLFARSPRARLTGFGYEWEVTYEMVETGAGEGFALRLTQISAAKTLLDT